MICRHYGWIFTEEFIQTKCGTSRLGVSIKSLSYAAESLGLKTIAAKMDYDTIHDYRLPAIIHWKKNHFVIAYKFSKKYVWIADPAVGRLKFSKKEFIANWAFIDNAEIPVGAVLILEPPSESRDFIKSNTEPGKQANLYKYIRHHRKAFITLILSLVISSGLQLMLPYLTQRVVDKGIAQKNLHLITLLLLGQLMVFLGSGAIDFARSWLLIKTSASIYVSLLSSFFIKLMRLPLSYFEAKIAGDIIQRIEDQGRVQSFLTTVLLSSLFSLLNLLVYTTMITTYSLTIFLYFLLGTAMYISWILLFLRVRKKLDYEKFELSAKNKSITLQIIQGIHDIKLNNGELIKYKNWERIQGLIFRVNQKSPAVSQFQQTGAILINQGKNIVVTWLTAEAVIDNKLSLGAMLAVQFIVGQLNTPIQQLVSFFQSLQDARISLSRVNEIHNMENEEPSHMELKKVLPDEKSISLNHVSYHYPGDSHAMALKNISLHIPAGKITAIVGASGSGKTTLIKLLLKFDIPVKGSIHVGNCLLADISHSYWRSKCGVVMQDGFIFSDSIKGNIAVDREVAKMEDISQASEIANIREFVEKLPASYSTVIGSEGLGLSQGQKQRILIARTVFKRPDYIFLDEATNALDANNEREIMENLETFFRGRTVVIVAHRLSTVKKADQIVVLDNGEIIEQGTHEQLVTRRKSYFNLIKNQLELGI